MSFYVSLAAMQLDMIHVIQFANGNIYSYAVTSEVTVQLLMQLHVQ